VRLPVFTWYSDTSAKEHVLSPLLFYFASEYAIQRFQINQNGLELNGALQLLVYVDNVTVWSGRVHTVKKNTESLVDELKGNAKYAVISRDQNAGQSHSIKFDKIYLERVEDFKHSGIDSIQE
jgi:hypothetical protein